MIDKETGWYEISHLDLATWLAWHGIWPDEIFYRDDVSHYFHRYYQVPPRELLEQWNDPENPVRQIIDIYNYTKRTSYAAKHTSLGEPVNFILPTVGGTCGERRLQHNHVTRTCYCRLCYNRPVDVKDERRPKGPTQLWPDRGPDNPGTDGGSDDGHGG